MQQPATAAASEGAQQRPLWGGALSVELPARFVDISDFREVPDFQEVFADPHADQSVTFETLEHLPEQSDEQIALYHWQHLLDDNGGEVCGPAPLTMIQPFDHIEAHTVVVAVLHPVCTLSLNQWWWVR